MGQGKSGFCPNTVKSLGMENRKGNSQTPSTEVQQVLLPVHSLGALRDHSAAQAAGTSQITHGSISGLHCVVCSFICTITC